MQRCRKDTKQCRVCEEGEWVIEHMGGHYMNESREVVGCLCRRAGTKEAKAGLAQEEAREGRQGVGENRG